MGGAGEMRERERERERESAAVSPAPRSLLLYGARGAGRGVLRIAKSPPGVLGAHTQTHTPRAVAPTSVRQGNVRPLFPSPLKPRARVSGLAASRRRREESAAHTRLSAQPAQPRGQERVLASSLGTRV